MTTSTSVVASMATAEALEFPSLLALCAELGSSDVGRRQVSELRPLSSRKQLEYRQALLRDAGRILQETALVPSQELPLLPLLEGLRLGELQSAGAQLVQLASVLRVAAQAKESIRSSEIDVPDLETLLSTLPDLEPLRRRIVKSLDGRGRVRDDASQLLVDLRRKVHRLRDGLYKQLQESLTEGREHYSTDTVSLKDGRLTLLLHSKAKGRVKGLVHGRSGTGQSLYFEPLAAMEGNNRLQETLEEEEAERRRIITEIIVEAQQNLPAIEVHFEILGELDLLQTLCRFAEASGSLLPEIVADTGLRLVRARHPLIDPQLASLREAALGQAGHRLPVVPLDLELDDEQRILVITGPNAGGKTVALKTLGLLSMAALSGLPIPAAAGTRIPMFTAIMAMVGDEQDLLADRSTFSARLIRLKEAWEIAGSRSLVLLDELGSGTDPEEGSALAVALLEGLLESRSLALLTTHLTQLAAVALERPGALCAAMEFDSESGEPTYLLRPGAPGGSQALALARRLGLATAWLERAEALLGDEHRDLRQLLAEVESVRQQLAATQTELEIETADLRKIRERLAEELAANREERKGLARKMKAELEDFRQRVTQRMRKEVDRAKEDQARGRKKGLVSKGVSRLFEDAPRIEVEVDEGPAGPMVVGMTVRHRSLGWSGELQGIRGEVAEVAVLGKRIRCSLKELVGVRENANRKARRLPRVELQRAREATEDIPVELNLVGERLEPALEELERYLDRALLSSRRQVRIVHGFGSGRLRAAVRDYLGPHPAVAEFRPGTNSEGGDGATVVALNKD